MKKILIISPHYPPSNLAAVHRTRLFALHLPSFGWDPYILTVHEKYYEEALDWNLARLIPVGQRVIKVNAFRITKPRLVGDIGIRGFFYLAKKAVELVRNEGIDFVYIPIPSFYCALLGPYIKMKTGVKYGIDYIDPWVHDFPGSDVVFSRHWWSTKLAKFLEPLAVRNASLITGVAEGYYKGVIERNPELKKSCVFGAMPYGGEPSDHSEVEKLNLRPYLFSKEQGKLDFVYAGAMLPKAYELLKRVFEMIENNRELFKNIRFHFIGSGKRANDRLSHNIKPVAEQSGIWERVVFEYPARIPYLDVLIHLNAADGIFILGSTEPHYTPSKVFQAVLSQKPIFAILHKDSTAFNFIVETSAGIAVPVDPVHLEESMSQFPYQFERFLEFVGNFDAGKVDMKSFEEYSARSVSRKLSSLVDEALTDK